MEKRVYEMIEKLTEPDRNSLLQVVLKKSQDPNCEESALYFSGEVDVFITVDGETVGITIGEAQHTVSLQKLLKKYKYNDQTISIT